MKLTKVPKMDNVIEMRTRRCKIIKVHEDICVWIMEDFNVVGCFVYVAEIISFFLASFEGSGMFIITTLLKLKNRVNYIYRSIGIIVIAKLWFSS